MRAELTDRSGRALDLGVTCSRTREFDVGPDASIYVAHFDFAKLLKLDGSGNLLDSTDLNDPSHLQGRPVYPRVGPDGLLYVNTTTIGGIIRYDPTTLDPVDVLPVTTQQGDFRFGRDGNIYAVNRDTFSIDVFDPRTKQYVDWNPATPQRDPFAKLPGDASPGPIVFGPDGDLFQIDFRKIVRYDGQTGASLGDFVPSPPTVADPGPVSMAFGPDGDLYVAYDNAQVLRYAGGDGHLLGTLIGSGPNLDHPGAMLFVPEPASGIIAMGFATISLRRRGGRLRRAGR